LKSQHIVIAGAGIGGLACALALAQAGQRVTLLERAPAFADIGAGIQLGPNAMRLLSAWGVEHAVLAQACLPEAIAVRDVATGHPLSRLLLGQAVQQRYGQVYASVHRADLHAALLQAVRQQPQVQLVCAAPVDNVVQRPAAALQASTAGADPAVAVQAAGQTWQADALVAADGVWSSVRHMVLADGAPRATGHAAYRALLPMARLPATLRSAALASEVGVWWGRDVHVVHYPVRRSEFLNLVVLSAQPAAQAVPGWASAASAQDVARHLHAACPALRGLVDSAQGISPWHSWHLYDRPAARSWVQGRVALLGDAAHPMLPYLAQGAAMALEDAAALADCVALQADWASALQAYQRLRKARCERVVATARRNGRIFHLAPPWSLARNAVLALKGTEVLGLPWLYGASPSAAIR
jgi:salicylate hydroxylase